jgi:hypothetical protein
MKMAKIYTAAEAYKIIRAGINKTAMQEIAEQAPVFAMYAAKGADEIISALPDFITAQKIEKAIKGENIPEPVKVSEPAPASTVETVAEEPKHENEQTVSEEQPKGKRGRPAKVKEEKPDTEEQPKKKRGRPAKVKAPEPVEEVEEEQDEDEQEEAEQEQEIEPDEPETEEPAEDDDDDDWEI